jgi:hypothetical protein
MNTYLFPLIMHHASSMKKSGNSLSINHCFFLSFAIGGKHVDVSNKVAFPRFETKSDCFRQIVVRVPIIKFYENPPSENWVVLFVWTAIQYTMELTVPFRSLVNAPKNQNSSATSAYDCANSVVDKYVFSLLHFRANQIRMHARLNWHACRRIRLGSCHRKWRNIIGDHVRILAERIGCTYPVRLINSDFDL